MSDLEKYETVLKSLREVIKVEKTLKKHTSKNTNYMEMTPTQIGRHQDTTTRLSHERNVALDSLHADLVDADLTKMKDNYDCQLLEHTHGCGGHVYKFKYTPRVPKKFQSRNRYE